MKQEDNVELTNLKKEETQNVENNRQVNEEERYTFVYAFKQQLLRAWQPVPTLTCAIIVYLIFGALFLGIGIFLYYEADSLHETRVRYDDSCGASATCNIIFNLAKEVKKPVFLYYEINNFYQNHRRYFKSKSPEQLRGGKEKTSGEVEDCEPVKKNSDIHFKTHSIGGTLLVADAVAIPCGAMARSYFNDSFVVTYTEASANTIIP